MNTVDAHLHVWDLRRAACPWLGPHLAPIDMSQHIDDVRPALQSNGVDAAVLVQVADNDEDRAAIGGGTATACYGLGEGA